MQWIASTGKPRPRILAMLFVTGAGISILLFAVDDGLLSFGDPDHTVEMVADDWFFEPENITVQKGDHVRLVIDSRHSRTGEHDHGINIPELGVREDLPAGEMTTVDFIAGEPGEYHYFCDVYCGEEHHKMMGTLLVIDRP